jgi:DUF4097 and DUF4098 domain-containing protein YvlB
MNARMVTRTYLPAAGTTLALLLAASAGAQSPRVEKHFSVAGKPVVMVQNPTGRIQVKAWGKHEVMVVSQHTGNSVGVEIVQVGNRIEIASIPVSGATASAEDLTTNYEISVPTETELQVRTDSGNVTVESVHGDMSFDTVAADLALQNVEGYLAIKSIGGSLVCTHCAGRLDATSISGNFQLIQPLMDNVRVQTSSGNILFDGTFLSRGIYVLKNYSGTIEVRFSSSDSFDVHAASLYGNVVNQAPVVQDQRRLRSQPPAYAPGMAKSLFGSLNEGQAKVELSSFSGTIKILKRE